MVSFFFFVKCLLDFEQQQPCVIFTIQLKVATKRPLACISG